MPNPDYIVTEARYDDEHIFIDAVRRWMYDGQTGEASNEQEVSRDEVIESIEDDNVHVTAPRDENQELQWGSKVEVIAIQDDWFLRTDGTPIRQDNLGNLPEF